MKQNVLVIGCGGIGCELVKLLIRRDRVNLTLLDFDTIEISNLNRQFFFTKGDVGRHKAQVIMEKLRTFYPDWNVKCVVDDVKNYDAAWFNGFDKIYNCLDNNESRKHVNLMCFLNNQVLIDGGSGGFHGQSSYFDYKNECFDCLPRATTKKYHVCTIRGMPTKFEHCIEYVKSVLFEDLGNPIGKDFIKYYDKELKHKLEVNHLEVSDDLKDDIIKVVRLLRKLIKKDKHNLKMRKCSIAYNKDDYDLNRLLYKLSCIRARSAHIATIPFFEAQTIANNIISSICSTNATVASMMLSSEKHKINYYLGSGKSCLIRVEPNTKNKDCEVCSKEWIVMNCKENSTVHELFDFLSPTYNCQSLIDSTMTFYSTTLNKPFTVLPNQTATIGLANGKTIKLYVLNAKEEFKILYKR